jgi:hypothetical protein
MKETEMGVICDSHSRYEKCMENIGWKIYGKRPLGRLRRRWEDNIRIDVREIGWGDVDWIHVAEDRDQWRAVVNTVFGFHKRWGLFFTS